MNWNNNNNNNNNKKGEDQHQSSLLIPIVSATMLMKFILIEDWIPGPDTKKFLTSIV